MKNKLRAFAWPGVLAALLIAGRAQAQADVATTLAVSAASVQAGNSVTFTATVKNNGTLVAANVVPKVQLPAGLLLVAANLPTGASYSNATGVVTLPTTTTLANGSALTYPITFNAPNYTATLPGTASSTATTTDPTPANNDGSQAAAKASVAVTLPANGCAGAPYGTSASSGLYAEYYSGYFNGSTTYFDGKTAALKRTEGTINFPNNNSWGNLTPAPTGGTVDDPDGFSARYRGSINITAAGSYSFTLTSDDASLLWLDGAALAPTTANALAAASYNAPQTKAITLSAGVHNVVMYYGENTGGNYLSLQYNGPDTKGNTVIVPNSVLCASMSQVPVANAVNNSPAILSNNGPTALNALSATDPDGQIDTYTILTLPASGAGTLLYNNGTTTTAVTAGQVIPAANAGNLFFNPVVSYSGTASFTYAATDNSGEVSNTATYNIPVTLAVADVTTTLSGPQQLGAGQPSIGNYTAVFTNNGPNQATQVTQVITLPVGATMTAAQVTASGGTYTAGSGTTAGTLSFSPVTIASGASKTYAFAITAPTATGNVSMMSTVGTNTNQGSNNAPDAATLAITVTPANRFVTYSDNNSLAANTKVTASVILNDDNPDATTAFTATVVAQPTHGAVTLNANGGYTYTPNPNYIGTDSFTYQICQTGTTPTCSNVSPVSLNIYDPNLVCTSGTGSNLLTNPSFTSGNTGFTSGYSYQAQSANALVPEGTYGVGNNANNYHPNFAGTGRTGAGDNFMIVNGAANIQRVYAQTVTVLPNRYYTFSVYANSVNPASPAQLGFVINNESTSVVTTLDGTTNFVKLSDVWFSGNSTSATFEVRDVNRATGGNDFGLDDVYFGTCTKNLLVDNITAPAVSKSANATTVPVLTGTASGGPTLASFTVQTLPPAASGILYLNNVAVKAGDVITVAADGKSSAGTLTFDPAAGFTGSQAAFTYTATDNNGAGSDNTGTYTIPLDTPLVAVDDAVTTPPNTPVSVAVTANDRKGASGSAIDLTTIDLQPGVAGVQQGTAANPIAVNNGTAYVNGSGQVVFTPTAGFLGTAFVPYTVKDASGILSNQATLLVQVVSQLDLATTITSPATGGTVTAGQPVTIAGTTANNSPAGTSASAVQQLQLPANLAGTPTFTRNGASITTATYDKATGLVVFPALALASGASATFGVTFAAPGTGPLTATASVNNGSPDVNLVDNVAAITLAVTPQFDLATTLTGPASATAGALATYTVVTANNGPSPVVGAQQTVQLPTGLAGAYATNGGTYDSNSGVVTFPALNLASGQAQTNSVSFSPTAGFSPSALVTPNTNGAGDPATANNTAYLNGATSSTAVAVAAPATSNRANLYVAVKGPSQVAPGATATYTVTQGNNGPNAATGVQTQVSLPAGLSTTGFTVGNAAGTLSTDGKTITFGTNGPAYTVATGLLVLPALATSQASGGAPQSYAISLPAPAAGPSLAVTASVRATTPDLVPGNNVATAETEIRPLADLAISLSRIEGGTTATGSALTAGQLVAYAVQTVNNSANPAQGVLQTVAIPAGIPVASLQLNGLIGTLSNGVITFGSGATYNVASGLLALPTLPTLAGNAVQTNTLSFAVPASSTALQAVATVSSPTADGTPANNTATVSNTVTALQDLSIALAGPAQAVQGSPAFFTVTATNNGASATGSQTTTVQLPTGLGASGFLVNNVAGTLSTDSKTITFGTNGPAYTVATGLLAMPAAVIGAPGTSTVTTVQFLAPANIAQLDVAAAVVAPSGTESDLANNAAQLSSLTVKSALANADLATTITSSLAGAQPAGTTATYSVKTANAATGAAAQNVVQTVALPAGLATATLKVNGISGSYSAATGLVTYNTTSGGTITYNPTTGALVFPASASQALNTSFTNTITFPLPVNGPVVVTATSSMDNLDGTPANNTATISTPVTSAATVAFGMSGPATTTAGNTVSYTLAATNNGPAAATDLGMTVTLPAGVTSYTLNGVAKTGSGTITIYGGAGTTVPAGQSVTNVIAFTAPAGSFTVSGGVSNSNSPTGTATATGSVTTTQANLAPVANDVANTRQGPQGNTGGGMLLSALSGRDPDGSVTQFVITSLPPSTQGVLKLGTSAIALNQIIALADTAKLSFTPASNFVGNAFFTYTATDNGATALTSAPATYTIPVAQDVSSTYAVFNTAKGGTAANKYATGDNLAQVLDANTAVYDAASAAVFDAATGALKTGAANGLPTTASSVNAVLASGTLPAGVALDATTGRIYVSDASKLLNYSNARTYALTITTTDLNGGTNTVPVTLTIGAYPLPVELVAFTATAVGNRDAALAWATASEKNNDHFDVERSLDGTTFVKIGQVKGQGSKSSATDYALTDAGIGAKAAGAVYYRLRQVDADGTASLSPVRSVSFAKTGPLAIGLYPNPAVASTQLDLSQLPAGSYQVSLVDMTGRAVLRASLAGAQLHALDLAPLASGSYVVLVRGTAADGTAVSLTKRLVKE